MRTDVDIAICGAGCAGLSLAAALARANHRGKVCLLEPRTTYQRDRTWCFWNTEDHPFSPAISRTWQRWRVSHNGRQATHQSARYRYCYIAGDSFYAQAIASVERHSQQQKLCRGIAVHSIEPHASGYLAIETSKGRLLAKHVFDSRPPTIAEQEPPALLQRFVGWHVRTPGFHFDPDSVELMHFLPSDKSGRVRFLYLLPFSRQEALVEMTYLDLPHLGEPDYEGDLRVWLGEHAPDWEVLYKEQGSLPMRAGAPVTQAAGESHIHPIGIRGGRLKPSSGYGFLRIQRHSRVIADALKTGGPIPNHAELPFYNAMDAVFLQVLTMSSADAVAHLFMRMFTHAPTDALVRFLSEISEPAEMLKVAFSLPKLTMLRAAKQLAASHSRASAFAKGYAQ